MTRPNLTDIKTVKIDNVPVKKIKLSRNEIIRKNSVTLNIILFFILAGIGYFLYNVYNERKIVQEYLKTKEDNVV